MPSSIDQLLPAGNTSEPDRLSSPNPLSLSTIELHSPSSSVHSIEASSESPHSNSLKTASKAISDNFLAPPSASISVSSINPPSACLSISSINPPSADTSFSLILPPSVISIDTPSGRMANLHQEGINAEPPIVIPVASGFKRIELADTYFFDVPNDFVCSISGGIITLPANKLASGGTVRVYDAFSLAQSLNTTPLSAHTRHTADKTIKFNFVFYQKMRSYFKSLLERDSALLNKGAHRDSLSLMTSYANEVGQESLMKLKYYSASHDIKLLKFTLIEHHLNNNRIARQRPQRPSNFFMPARSYNWDRTAGNLFLWNVLSIAIAWILSTKATPEMTCIIFLGVIVGVWLLFLPITINEFNLFNRVDGFITLPSGIAFGYSTIGLGLLLETTGVFASPLINIGVATSLALLPSCSRATQRFMNTNLSFLNNSSSQYPRVTEQSEEIAHETDAENMAHMV